MASISSIKSLTLDLPPSCIAFCPSRPQFFVVGTYFLHPKEQQTAASNTSEVGAPDGGDAADNSIQQEAREREGKQLRTGSLILFRLGDDDTM